MKQLRWALLVALGVCLNSAGRAAAQARPLQGYTDHQLDLKATDLQSRINDYRQAVQRIQNLAEAERLGPGIRPDFVTYYRSEVQRLQTLRTQLSQEVQQLNSERALRRAAAQRPVQQAAPMQGARPTAAQLAAAQRAAQLAAALRAAQQAAALRAAAQQAAAQRAAQQAAAQRAAAQAAAQRAAGQQTTQSQAAGSSFDTAVDRQGVGPATEIGNPPR